MKDKVHGRYCKRRGGNGRKRCVGTAKGGEK
jgi:hypothetical protein